MITYSQSEPPRPIITHTVSLDNETVTHILSFLDMLSQNVLFYKQHIYAGFRTAMQRLKDNVRWLQTPPLTPGQQYVSQRDVVQQDAGHAQRHHHQPAHERHGPVKRATDTNTQDYSQIRQANGVRGMMIAPKQN